MCSTCSRTRAATGCSTWGTPVGYIGTDVYARFMRMHGATTCCMRWATARSGSTRSSTPSSTAVTAPTRPTPTSPTCGGSSGRSVSVTTRAAASRPPTRSTTAGPEWIFLQIFDSWFDDEQLGNAPVRSPRLVAELESGTRHRRQRRQPRWGWRGPASAASTRRAVVDSYRLAYLDDATVNWCPGALGTVLANEEVTADGRSGERGNRPDVPASAEAVEAAHHRVRGSPARRPGPARLARLDQDHAAQLDRQEHRRARGVRRAGARRPRHRGVHHPPRHAVRRDVHGASPPSLRCSTRSCRPWWPRRRRFRAGPRRHARRVEGHLRRRRAPLGRGAQVPRVRGAEERAGAPGRRARQDRCVHRCVHRDQPDQRGVNPDLRRPRLRADGLRHGGDHGGARARRARLHVRPGVRAADREGGAAAGRLVARPRARRLDAGERVARGVPR